MSTHGWQPIQPIPEESGHGPEHLASLDTLDSLQRLRLSTGEEDPETAERFLEQLLRRLAIETGIIEGIYTLNRGATKTLVSLGIAPDLIVPGSTDRDPGELARILADHQDAVSGVYQEIRDGRPITRSAVRQLHSTITRNQPTYRAVDQFGKHMDLPLEHGGFKSMPNNPTRPDGSVHEYCPPEHVDSEMDYLLAWHQEYSENPGIHHPVLAAAWFHHRFTQIHPFQDGNGRVARALLTWELVRAGYLPAVIGRDDRAAYIAALERADSGELDRLAAFLAHILARTTLEALDGPEPGETPGTVTEALDLVVGRVGPFGSSRESQIRSAEEVMTSLKTEAAAWLEEQALTIRTKMGDAGAQVETTVQGWNPETGHREDREAALEAMDLEDHPIAAGDPREAVRLEVIPQERTGQPGFTLTIAFHHAGRRPKGAMIAFSFSSVGRPGQRPQGHFRAPGTMVFTTMDRPENLGPRLEAWAEGKLAAGLAWWAEHF